MRIVFLFIFSFLISGISFAQNNVQNTFLKIGKQTVSQEEFERIYNKNNSLSTAEKQSVEEYLQMFINFKLKVEAAVDAGYDTLSSFKNELNGYRDQLAKSYLTDYSTVDALILEAYERMHTEVNASHIMIALKAEAPPQDTLAAWKKIIDIRNRILAGESFEKLAVELSEDPSAKSNKGNLGYFTSFQMVYPFETAAFNNKIGEISNPVRTRFGYHILKTNDKRPARGEVHVAHIMCIVPQGSSDSLWIKADKKINSLYSKLKEGADFAKTAQESSEDVGSSKNGGELPWFGTGRMVPEFEQAAFKLQNPGDYSAPVKTSYGWHLIKLLEKRSIPEFETVKSDLKNKITRDERAEAGSTSFVNKIKAAYGFTENKELLNQFYVSENKTNDAKTPVEKSKKQTVDPKTKKTISLPVESSPKKILNLNIDENTAQKVLFSFANTNYTVVGFMDYLKTIIPWDSAKSAENYINDAYHQYTKITLLAYENSQLESKYADFKNLIQEYHDGILLFNLSDSLIWSKASKDTAGLEAFYGAQKNQYMWPERLEASVVTCKTMDLAQKAIKNVKKIKTHEKIQNQLVSLVCDTIVGLDCISLEDSRFSRGENPAIDSIAWEKGITKPFTKNGKIQFVVIYNKLAPMPKSLDESRGLIIADYQTYLDNQWVSQLRKKYPIFIDSEILNQLKNKYAGKN